MTRELIERAQRGDRDAFGEVARLYAPFITGAILARRERFQDAEDLVQETFLRAIRQIGTLRDPDRIGAWLYGIAVNVVREHRRSEARLPAVLERDAPAPAPVSDAGVDPERLKTCLERIPERLRELFILRHIQGMSYRQLGELRGATLTSVGERLWKARQLLRRCLERGASSDMFALGSGSP
jgi:RNA polymerase sigma-70 factor (ECF subfamily)